jgi:hypothetical protein
VIWFANLLILLLLSFVVFVFVQHNPIIDETYETDVPLHSALHLWCECGLIDVNHNAGAATRR